MVRWPYRCKKGGFIRAKEIIAGHRNESDVVAVISRRLERLSARGVEGNRELYEAESHSQPGCSGTARAKGPKTHQNRNKALAEVWHSPWACARVWPRCFAPGTRPAHADRALPLPPSPAASA